MAQAWIISEYSFGRIDQEAELLVTGTVVKTTALGVPPASVLPYKDILQQMRAEVRVLRVAPKAGTLEVPSVGDTITVLFYGFKHEQAGGNGPWLPDLPVGRTVVFPLRKTEGKANADWELIAVEDCGLMIRATAAAPVGTAATNVEFLGRELANVFVQGSPEDLLRTVRYAAGWDEPVEPVITVLQAAKITQAHWAEIAVTTYCICNGPQKSLASVAKEDVRFNSFLKVVKLAMSHLPREGLDDLLIEAALAQSSYNAQGVTKVLENNYPEHPTMLATLTRMLNADTPGAVAIAANLIKSKDHPLIGAALQAAQHRLRTPHQNAADFNYAWVGLIRDYGSAQDFAALLSAMRQAQKSDFTWYTILFTSFTSKDSPRTIAVCRIYITDTRDFNSTLRMCDLAALDLQRITNHDFGMAINLTLTERDAACELARDWLETHPLAGEDAGA